MSDFLDHLRECRELERAEAPELRAAEYRSTRTKAELEAHPEPQRKSAVRWPQGVMNGDPVPPQPLEVQREKGGA